MQWCHTTWWAQSYRHVTEWTWAQLSRMYARAQIVHVGGIRGEQLLHFLLVNVLVSLPYLLFDKYRLRFVELALKLTGQDAALPELDAAMDVSRIHLAAHAVFCLTWFVPQRYFVSAVAYSVLVVGLAAGVFDLASVVLVGMFGGLVWWVASFSRGRRVSPFVLLLPPYLAFINVCQYLTTVGPPVSRFLSEDSAVVQVVRWGAAFLPIVWYAAYEFRSGRLDGWLGFWYFGLRLLKPPVFSPRELRPAEGETLHWQWRGLFALGTAFVALAVSWHLKGHLEALGPDWHLESGVRLLRASYCYYLGTCFDLVGQFNIFVGWARLFGLPIGSVFRFWLFARTPNERWQRWNLPFREWILTTVFYPLMRARRGVFVAVMATMLSSGAIHLLGTLTPARFDWTRCLQLGLYWSMNGLAIYFIISVPRWFPRLVDRLRLRESVAWAVVGIFLTLTFYSTLFVARDHCDNVAQMVALCRRLIGS